MKLMIMTLLVTVSLIACTRPPTASARTTNNTATAPIVTSTIPKVTPTQTTASNVTDEAEVRNLVENFGKRLQTVSLLAPDATQEIQKQYSDFVSPTLLDMWMNDVSKAPGRMVSSPWPDRIEIITLLQEDPDKYVITGWVVGITSTEIFGGEAALKTPVCIVIQRGQGRWLITEYAEER